MPFIGQGSPCWRSITEVMAAAARPSRTSPRFTRMHKQHGKRMLVLAPRAKKRLIYGHSLGGAVAIDLALTAAHLDGLVVEGTYTSFSEVVQTTRYGWLPLSLILTQKYTSDEKIRNIRVPKLFIHGSSDEVIPVEMGKRLYDMSLEPKSLLIVPDGRHRDTAVKAGDEWIKAMRRLAGLDGSDKFSSNFGSMNSSYPRKRVSSFSKQSALMFKIDYFRYSRK